MNNLRLISFLPAATEMACALGLEEQIVGVSHECDFPPAVRGKPVVVRCALPVEKMTLRGIDAAVAERIGSGGTLYEVDQPAIERLAPTHILTQALCQVCAPSGGEIARALQALPSRPQILWFTPHCLDDIFANLRELGEATGRLENAEALIAAGRERLRTVAALMTRKAPRRPRVFCLEWIDPYYSCGHWVPEMIELAGSVDALGRKGADSVRTTWKEIAAWAPEILIVSPCGFGVEQAVEQTKQLLQQPGWSDLPAVRQGRVFAVNANAYFARPGPRIVDGVELLAHLFHPELCDWRGPANAFRRVRIESRASSVTSRPSVARIKICPECGELFPCKTGNCWCDKLPPLKSAMPGTDCLCPKCLQTKVGSQKSEVRSQRSAIGGLSAVLRPPATGFTLIELLVVIAIIGVLSAMLLPVLARGKLSAQRAVCESNLRQLGFATQLYWDDYAGDSFPYTRGTTNNGTLYWFGWINTTLPEGQRPFDLSAGALFPYLQGSDVRLCPSPVWNSPQFKRKGTNVIFSYGCNSFVFGGPGHLTVNANKIFHPADTVLFADAAQVNDFQAPASRAHPMFEEWYYVDLETNYGSPRNYPNGQFRHAQRANVAFADGHVDLEKPAPGSIDQRLPNQFIGQLRPDILTVP